jgi:hypothetical protein
MLAMNRWLRRYDSGGIVVKAIVYPIILAMSLLGAAGLAVTILGLPALAGWLFYSGNWIGGSFAAAGSLTLLYGYATLREVLG